MLHRIGVLVGVLVVALASLMLSACSKGGGGESAYVGKWKLDKEAFKAAVEAEMKKEKEGEDAGMASFAAAMILGMIENMEMEVDIKSDHTFVVTTKLTEGDESQTDTESGTWSLDGTSILMSSSGEEAGSGESSGRATIKNGKLHLTNETEPDQPAMIFKK